LADRADRLAEKPGAMPLLERAAINVEVIQESVSRFSLRGLGPPLTDKPRSTGLDEHSGLLFCWIGATSVRIPRSQEVVREEGPGGTNRDKTVLLILQYVFRRRNGQKSRNSSEKIPATLLFLGRSVLLHEKG